MLALSHLALCSTQLAGVAACCMMMMMMMMTVNNSDDKLFIIICFLLIFTPHDHSCELGGCIVDTDQ